MCFNKMIHTVSDDNDWESKSNVCFQIQLIPVKRNFYVFLVGLLTIKDFFND